MKQKLKRLLSSVLASATVFSSFAGILPQAGAISGGDTVTLIYENDKQTYLREQKNGSWVSLPIHEGYALENGEKLQVYCMDHGKHGIHEIAPSTNKHTYILDSGSGYTQNPKAVGVIMRGSGRLSLQSFFEPVLLMFRVTLQRTNIATQRKTANVGGARPTQCQRYSVYQRQPRTGILVLWDAGGTCDGSDPCAAQLCQEH